MNWLTIVVLAWLIGSAALIVSWCWAARAEDDWQDQLVDELRARAALQRASESSREVEG